VTGRSVCVSLGLALSLLAAGCGSSSPSAGPAAGGGFRGTPAPASGVAADFALRDQSGKVVQLSAQRGKVVLLTFLYTTCPDVCPLIASNMNQALRDLGTRRAAVRVLAVSTDPAGDTPKAVRAYVAAHRLLPQFHYLIGSQADLKPIWKAYNVLVERQGDQVLHTTFVLLIDRAGKPKLFYTPQVQAATLLHDLKRLV
jgi:protein SCO1/2